jgi:hypothetical protein
MEYVTRACRAIPDRQAAAFYIIAVFSLGRMAE